MDFVKLLDNAKIDYVVVSGYIAIVFGRPRGTEDVDIFIKENIKNLNPLISKNEIPTVRSAHFAASCGVSFNWNS